MDDSNLDTADTTELPMGSAGLTLEHEFRIRQVELQAAELDREELYECLVATWVGWMHERQLIRGVISERFGGDLVVETNGCMPEDVLRDGFFDDDDDDDGDGGLRVGR